MPANFSTKDKHDPSKNYTDVIFGSDAKLLEVELNEMQKIQRDARAELLRSQVHSGVIDYMPTVRIVGASQARPGELTLYADGTSPDYMWVGKFDAIINGYKVLINDFDKVGVPNKVNRIPLPKAPTFGSREDLVFLEAWFEEVDYSKDASIRDSRYNEETTRRTKLNWRIRSVAGVDFERYKVDGFLESLAGVSPTMNNPLLSPQGSNEEPIVVDTADWRKTQFLTVAQRDYYVVGTAGATNDTGLYIAGDGSQASKDLLKTADGYVYAIPLFRVKRRNSGGYRVDNLNGAVEYRNLGNLRLSFDTDVSKGKIGIFTGTTDKEKMTNLQVGDIIGYSVPTIEVTKIVDADTIEGIWLLDTSYSQGASGVYNKTYTNRPDGKFANIVHQDDIIDLRHKVNVTGYNYQQLLEENFDKLLRGELQTKEKPKSVKDRFNLRKADRTVNQELVPKRVLGNDGVERELVNLLGASGGFETDSNNDGVADGISTYNVTSPSLVTGYFKSGKAQRFSGGFISFDQLIVSTMSVGKYYLIAVDFFKDTCTSAELRLYNGSTGNMPSMTASESGTLYIKFLRASGDYTSSRIYANSGFGVFDNLRLYEIDQATYDKIDVDPAFTGEELAKKLPYVSSYPNMVENLFDLSKTQPLMLDIVGSTLNISESTDKVTISDNKATINLSGSGKGMGRLGISILPKKYQVYAEHSAEWQFHRLIAYKSDGSRYTGSIPGWTLAYESYYKAVESGKALEIDLTGTGVVKCDYLLYRGSTGITFPINLYASSWAISDSSTIKDSYIPYGKYYLPDDYAEGLTKTYLSKVNEQRSIVSEAMTSEVRNDIIEALNTPQKHITVTQATKGTWAVNDIIKIESSEGVITGALDSDTALAKVVSSVVSNAVVTVDDVSKLAVNDTVVLVHPDMTVWSSTERTITAIDSTNKTVTLSSAYNADISGGYFVETTASTSSPVVTASGIAGTWSGLGTKEATYTITTAPTTTTDPIKLQYSVNYPAGQGVEYLPSEVLEGSVNGQKVVKATDNIVRVKTNYEGKVHGSMDMIPHTSHARVSSELVAPDYDTWHLSTAQYGEISRLDGTLRAVNTGNIAGDIPQQRFSFDLVRILEDKFGEQFFADCLTKAEKVAKAKSTVSNFTCLFYGYGSSPSGNKATLNSWKASTAEWVGIWSNYSDSPSLITWKASNYTSSVANRVAHIDSNGFIHFLAHAEPSDGVTASTINTDYVELEVELNVAETGYEVFVPEEQKPVLIDDSKNFEPGENMVGGFLTDPRWVLHVDAEATDDRTLYSPTNNGITYIKFRVAPGTSYELSTEILGGIGRVYWREKTVYNGNTRDKILVDDKNGKQKASLVTSKEAYEVDLWLYARDTSGLATTFKDLVISPTAVPASYRQNTKLAKRKTVHNFLGKVAGSTVKNPHSFYALSQPLMGSPNKVNERNQSGYDSIGKLDGLIHSVSNSVNSYYSQQLFEFDLSHLGLSLSELKKALRKLTVSWTGYGVGTKDEIANPTTAPTLAVQADPDTTTALPAGTYSVRYTWVNANGETSYSPLSSITTADGEEVVVTIPALPAGATSANIYFDAGDGVGYYLQGNTTTTSYTQSKALDSVTAMPNTNTSGVLTNGATGRWWNANTSAWEIANGNGNTSNIPTTGNHSISSLGSIVNYVNNDQKFYVLVHSTYPAGGVSPSEIYTDYVKLEVELADYVDYVPANVIKVKKETKEMKLQYPAKSYRTGIMDDIELFYKSIPLQEQELKFSSGEGTILSLKDRMLITTALHSEGIGIITNSHYSNFMNRLPLKSNMYDLSSTMVKGVELDASLLDAIASNKFTKSVPISSAEVALNGQGGFSSSIVIYNSRLGVRTGSRTSYATFSHSDKVPTNVVYILPILVEDNGEVKMVIATGFKYATNLVYCAGTSVVGIYTIEGRPLVKGVN